MNRKSLIGIVGFFVLFAGIIAGTYLVSQNQDFRERAAPATTVYISPATQTKDVGETFNFSVNMDTASNQVTGVDIRLKYNPSLVEVTSIEKGFGITVLNTEINNLIDNTSGKISYAIFTVNKDNAITGSGVEILKVSGKIKAGASGTASITFDAGTVISGVSEGQNVITGTTPASIIIADALGSTPVATATSRATTNPGFQPLPTGTATTRATSTATSTSSSHATATSKATSTATSTGSEQLDTSVTTAMPIPVTGSSFSSIASWGVGLFFILISYLLLGY
jgi:hypothetical protein